MGQYEKAIKDYTQTLKLRPNLIQAYNYRGIVRFKMNDYNGALSDYTKAINLGKNLEMPASQAKELGLNSSSLFFNRASVLQKQGKHEDAIIDYDNSIEIDPSNKMAFYNRAVSHLALKNKKSAIEDLIIAHSLGYDKANELIKKIDSLKIDSLKIDTIN